MNDAWMKNKNQKEKLTVVERNNDMNISLRHNPFNADAALYFNAF